MPDYFPLQTCYGEEPLNIEGPLRHVPPTEFDSIIDLGCGGGRTAIWLSVRGNCKFKAVYGVDFEAGMLAKYEETVKQYGLFAGAEFKTFCCGFQCVPLPPKSCQFVTSYMAFHHAPQDEARDGLATARGLMRDDAYLCLWNAFTPKLWTEDEVRRSVEASFGRGASVVWHQGFWHVINDRFARLASFTY